DAACDIRTSALELLGRDSRLTDRTDLWATVLEEATSPFFGVGFMSFWAGERLGRMADRIGTVVLQAHNGYIEQYLNLGYVGVTFIVALIGQGIIRVRSLAARDWPLAMLRLCFVVTAVLYNYTEASFYGINNMWILFLLGILDVPENVRRSWPSV